MVLRQFTYLLLCKHLRVCHNNSYNLYWFAVVTYCYLTNEVLACLCCGFSFSFLPKMFKHFG